MQLHHDAIFRGNLELGDRLKIKNNIDGNDDIIMFGCTKMFLHGPNLVLLLMYVEMVKSAWLATSPTNLV